eukprot:1486602-Pleurochrysis_carterae.AAC.2
MPPRPPLMYRRKGGGFWDSTDVVSESRIGVAGGLLVLEGLQVAVIESDHRAFCYGWAIRPPNHFIAASSAPNTIFRRVPIANSGAASFTLSTSMTLFSLMAAEETRNIDWCDLAVARERQLVTGWYWSGRSWRGSFRGYFNVERHAADALCGRRRGSGCYFFHALFSRLAGLKEPKRGIGQQQIANLIIVANKHVKC